MWRFFNVDSLSPLRPLLLWQALESSHFPFAAPFSPLHQSGLFRVVSVSLYLLCSCLFGSIIFIADHQHGGGFACNEQCSSYTARDFILWRQALPCLSLLLSCWTHSTPSLFWQWHNVIIALEFVCLQKEGRSRKKVSLPKHTYWLFIH